ncbi:Coatomer subunit zeta-1 [Fragariocoptes setiger]|uniref:Coatomer subunit zeta-1 n=1 Tax=Fragariocoptes setiger TaxID=1670756 RepID=A0ABQ7SA10_9ACAR|nr:Coatomer subunit zeta-1 [Fragariocoptes setiger]
MKGEKESNDFKTILHTIKAIIVLDIDGNRVLSKHYDTLEPNIERKIYNRTHRSRDEIVLVDGLMVLHEAVVDLHLYVVGHANENPIILSNVLNCLHGGLSLLLHNQVERKVLMDNLDQVIIFLDEICDSGDMDCNEIIGFQFPNTGGDMLNNGALSPLVCSNNSQQQMARSKSLNDIASDSQSSSTSLLIQRTDSNRYNLASKQHNGPPVAATNVVLPQTNDSANVSQMLTHLDLCLGPNRNGHNGVALHQTNYHPDPDHTKYRLGNMTFEKSKSTSKSSSNYWHLCDGSSLSVSRNFTTVANYDIMNKLADQGQRNPNLIAHKQRHCGSLDETANLVCKQMSPRTIMHSVSNGSPFTQCNGVTSALFLLMLSVYGSALITSASHNVIFPSDVRRSLSSEVNSGGKSAQTSNLLLNSINGPDNSKLDFDDQPDFFPSNIDDNQRLGGIFIQDRNKQSAAALSRTHKQPDTINNAVSTQHQHSTETMPRLQRSYQAQQLLMQDSAVVVAVASPMQTQPYSSRTNHTIKTQRGNILVALSPSQSRNSSPWRVLSSSSSDNIRSWQSGFHDNNAPSSQNSLPNQVTGKTTLLSMNKHMLTRPLQFSGLRNVAIQSANTRSYDVDSVNFSTHGMDHLYLMTNFVLDYLLDNELPQELINQTLFTDPLPVLDNNRTILIHHFHRVLLAACVCLCLAISIPLFGFLIVCCWCSEKSKYEHRDSLDSPSSHDARSTRAKYSGSRHRSRSHGGTRHYDSRSHGGLDRHRRSGPNSSRHRHQSSHSRPAPRRESSVEVVKYESFCSPCVRAFLASNTFIVLLLMAFFVVCNFVTNENVYSGVSQLPKTLNQSLDDLEAYLNVTDYEVDNLLKANFQQLEQELNSRLDSGGLIIKHKLATVSEASALSNLTDMVADLNDTKTKLEQLDKELSFLKHHLNLARGALKNLESKIVSACTHRTCTTLNRKYLDHPQSFKISSNYERLPSVRTAIEKITTLLNNNIINEVQKGRNQFELLASGIQGGVNEGSQEIKRQLSLVGKQLAEIATDISRSLKIPIEDIETGKANTWRLLIIGEFEHYRRYICLIAAVIVFFIFAMYCLGWIYGSCKPQPTYRTRHAISRTSASASPPFTCGIVTVFIVFLPLMIGAITFFIAGSVGDKIVCQVVKHPERNQSRQIFAMLQNHFLNAQISISPNGSDATDMQTNVFERRRYYKANIADLIERCHNNKSIYNVLRLDVYDRIYLVNDRFYQGYNLSAITDFKRGQNMEFKLKDLLRRIDVDPSRITLLSQNTEELLRKMMTVSFDDLETAFSRLFESGAQITTIDFAELTKDLNAEAEINDNSTAQVNLALAALDSDTINHKILANITSCLGNLREGIRHLRLHMSHGRSAFGSVIAELMGRVKSAEVLLHREGKQLIRDVANDYIKEMNGLIDQYANHVQNQVENVIGRCEPISRAINSTSAAICDDIVQPFNGFWFSLISSLLLVLIATVLVSLLKGLYKQAKRGSSPHHYSSRLHRRSGSNDFDADLSYEDEGEDIALAYLDRPPKVSSSMPSAPIVEDGWSPSAPSQHFVHATRPPPYVL